MHLFLLFRFLRLLIFILELEEFALSPYQELLHFPLSLIEFLNVIFIVEKICELDLIAFFTLLSRLQQEHLVDLVYLAIYSISVLFVNLVYDLVWVDRHQV